MLRKSASPPRLDLDRLALLPAVQAVTPAACCAALLAGGSDLLNLVLAQVDQLFAVQGIPYVVMKGVHVRECVYPDAALRPACDIDILIAPPDRRRAAQVLLHNGYTAHVLPNNVSFEATFSSALVDIDLHWSMLRQGRTRVDMSAGLVARRQQTNGVWGLGDSDA